MKMERQILLEFESLKNNIIKMATLVDDQIDKAFTALETHDLALCKWVKSKDREVDAFDNLVQAQTENLLALYQPVASDLRFIIASIKINNQLERFGDIAVNLAQRVKRFTGFEDVVRSSRLLEMGGIARKMSKDAIDAFINADTTLARSVLERDDRVDELNKEVFNAIIARMETEPRIVRPGAHLIILSRHIERLADHATNIAEEVLFLVSGDIVSHSRKLNNGDTRQ